MFRIPFFKYGVILLERNSNELVNCNELEQKLITNEKELRKKSFSSSKMKLNNSFFDDSDLKGKYYLLVVFQKSDKKVLLSARYYSDTAKIEEIIKGEFSPTNYILQGKISKALKNNNLILIDRMCADFNNSNFRKNRSYLHLLFYNKLYKENKTRELCAMARSSKSEYLLNKYLLVGLNIIGKTKHNNLDHWILFGDFKLLYQKFKNSTKNNILFILMRLFN